MTKTASSIQVRDTHRREYRRTMRIIAAGSVVLWCILAIYLGNAFGGGVIVPMSIIMLVGMAVIRFTLWRRYRQDMRADLASQDVTHSHAVVARPANVQQIQQRGK